VSFDVVSCCWGCSVSALEVALELLVVSIGAVVVASIPRRGRWSRNVIAASLATVVVFGGLAFARRALLYGIDWGAWGGPSIPSAIADRAAVASWVVGTAAAVIAVRRRRSS
jgi:hypothetical protein